MPCLCADIALKHAGLPVEIFIEEDCEESVGRLHYIDVLYVTMPHISDSATAGIASWVASGGTVFATAGAGMLTQANASNVAMATLLGVTQQAVYSGTQDDFNNTVRLIKQDINFVEVLDNVTVTTPTTTTTTTTTSIAAADSGGGDSPLVAKGIKSIFTITATATTSSQPEVDGRSTTATTAAAASAMAEFSDGKPALVVKTVGKGRAFYAGFLPGLAYFAPAIPLRPVDRSSVDEGMDHFIPTEFAEAARDLITLPLAGRLNESSVRPVIASHPLVEVGWVYAKGIGSVLPCVNWAGAPLAGFTVTLNHPELLGSLKTAVLSSGGKLQLDKEKGTITFDLVITADAIVLR